MNEQMCWRVTELNLNRRTRALWWSSDQCSVHCSARYKVTAHSDPNLALQAAKNNASIAYRSYNELLGPYC
jgi:hypothetical protein